MKFTQFTQLHQNRLIELSLTVIKEFTEELIQQKIVDILPLYITVKR